MGDVLKKYDRVHGGSKTKKYAMRVATDKTHACDTPCRFMGHSSAAYMPKINLNIREIEVTKREPYLDVSMQVLNPVSA